MCNLDIHYLERPTKRQIDELSKLSSRAKERRSQGLFLAEGFKMVRDMLGTFVLKNLFITESLFQAMSKEIQSLDEKMIERVSILPEDYNFNNLSNLKHAQSCLALFYLPKDRLAEVYEAKGLVLFLDSIQDPGNLGTIIRTADWFGVDHVVCTENTVDAFSPKVVQATMGALARVQVHRLQGDAEAFLSRFPGEKIGTFLNGENIYRQDWTERKDSSRLLIMGNEGQGISPLVEQYVDTRITIPSFTPKVRSESLNVAIATALCLSEILAER